MTHKDKVESEAGLMAETEGYVRARERSEAEKMGFKPKWTRDELLRFFEQNGIRSLFAAIDGTTDESVAKFLDDYEQLSKRFPDASLDELSSQLNLGSIIKNIEQACARLNEPIRAGAISFMSAEFKIGIDQTASLVNPEINVIRTTAVLEVFCNQISKVMARTLLYLHPRPGFHFRPHSVARLLANNSVLVEHWLAIISHYAVFGVPPNTWHFTQLKGEPELARRKILVAMELFAVAHEYGHHARFHESGQADESNDDSIKKEYDADNFALRISQEIGLRGEFVNEFSYTGGAAIILFTMIDLVERTKQVLQFGLWTPPPTVDHPAIADRIRALETLDGSIPAERRGLAKRLRLSMFAIAEIIWGNILPGLVEMHFNNIRPQRYDPETDTFGP